MTAGAVPKGLGTGSGTGHRSGADRRRRPTPAFSRYWLRGRRGAGRRAGEQTRIYVDRYTPGEISLVFGVVLLSLTDLCLTLLHLSGGGAEVNPVMAGILAGGGTHGFTAAKIFATLLGAGVLWMHVRFPGVRRALQAVVLLYACLLAWHGVVALDRWAG